MVNQTKKSFFNTFIAELFRICTLTVGPSRTVGNLANPRRPYPRD